MRKIKITALVLAVLMVMAAFAGCASKSAVEDLDERVTALEGKIDANQKANEEKIDELAALIEALTKSQSDIKDSVESNKNDQAASNQQILDAINKLTEKVEQVEKDQDAADKADKEAQAAAKELQAYKATNAAKIATLEASYLANKADYAAEDYVKVVEILANANIAVEQANDKAAVDAAMKKLDTDLKGYTTVNQGLYNIYLELKGNIVAGDATKALVEKAQAALTAAQKHYAADLTKITKFAVGGYQADGKTPLTFDLVNGITVLCTVYTSTIDSYNTRLQVVEADGTVTTYATLAYVEARAKELITSIELASKLEMILANTTTLITLGDQYKAWLDFANLLSTKNAALVTNAAKLDEYVAAAKNLLAAQKAFGETLNFDPVTKAPASIFKAYNDLADKTLYTNYEIVYANIDTVVAAWKAQYNLTDKQVADIIAAPYTYVNTYNVAVTVHTGLNYTTYKTNRDLCKQYFEKYKVFSQTIAPQIKALNAKFVSINNADHIKEFRAIAQAIDAWLYTRNNNGAITKTWVDATNFNAMVNNIGLKTGYAYGLDTTAAQNVDFLGLYTFGQGQYSAPGVINAFFENTYFSAKAVADALNAAIADASSASVWELIEVSGEYNMDATNRKFWAKTDAELDALATAAADYFASTVTVAGIALPVYKAPAAITGLNIATFKRSSQEYDLAAVLVDTAALNAKKASIEARVQALKPVATEIVATLVYKSGSNYPVLTADLVEAKVNLDEHEAKINGAYNDKFLPNWVLDGAVVAYAEAVVAPAKVMADVYVNGTNAAPVNTEITTYVYTLVDLLTAAQCETLHAAAGEVEDLRKQADVLIAAYKTIADLNAATPITIKSIIDDTRWFEFSYAAKASKGLYYMTYVDAAKLVAGNIAEAEAIAAGKSDTEIEAAVNAAKAAAEAKALLEKKLFDIVLYEDEVSAKEELAKVAFATELAANALDYATMIEAVSAYYATFKADNAGKTAKDVTAAMGDFAKYELMAKKAVVLEAVKAQLDTAVSGKPEVEVNAVAKFYNTIFEAVSAAKDMKAVKDFLESADLDAQWTEYALGAITVPATTYAGASLLAAVTIG